jgi:hypothetical protein
MHDSATFSKTKHRREEKQRGQNSPALLPAAATPFANALLRTKYCGKTATLGINRRPAPTPTTIPCDNKTCQYRSQRLNIMCPKTTRKDPVQIKCVK